MKTWLKLAGLATVGSFLAYGSVVTAADNFVVKDGSGATITKRSKDTGSGVQADLNGIINTSNTQIDPATESTVNSVKTAVELLDDTVKAEDAASANADPGIVINTKRLDTAAASSGTDGDYQPFITDGSGRLWVNAGGLPAFIGSGSAAVITSGACATLEGCLRSMRDDMRTIATDTNPVPITNDGTNILQVKGAAGTVTTTVTRPANTTAYTAGDSYGDSTGGHELLSMCRASGGSGILTDFILVYSTTQVVVGEVHIYDASITEADDNAAFAISDSDQLKLVGKIAFTTVAEANNSVYHEKNLNMGYTCSGTDDLRFQVKITTGYTPASADTLTIRAKVIYTN